MQLPFLHRPHLASEREQRSGKGPVDPYLCSSAARIMRASVFHSRFLLTKEVCCPWAL